VGGLDVMSLANAIATAARWQQMGKFRKSGTERRLDKLVRDQRRQKAWQRVPDTWHSGGIVFSKSLYLAMDWSSLLHLFELFLVAFLIGFLLKKDD
jgi:hypothetical protein